MDLVTQSDAARTKRRRLVFLSIPVAAFFLGTAATIVVARSASTPYLGVYRQAAVAVRAERSGKIIEILEKRGEEVRSGDALCTIEDSSLAGTIAALTAKRDELKRQLDAVNAKAAVEMSLRLDAVEKERLDARLRYADLLRARFDVELRRQALEDLQRAGVSAETTAEIVVPASAESQGLLRRLGIADADNHTEVLNTQITLCEERLAELDRLKSELPEQIERSFGVDRIRDDLEAIEQRLESAKADDAKFSPKSPAFGRVGVYRRSEGEFVSAGETLVEIFDSERPYVLVTVPVSKLVELTSGRRVRVEFEGIRTRKPLEGVVAEVTSEAERDADAANTPGGTYAQVRIDPIGRLWPTPLPGCTARVTLLTDSTASDEQ